MNELTMFAECQPAVTPLLPEERQQIWEHITRVVELARAASTDAPLVSRVEVFVGASHGSSLRPRHRALVAAVLIAVGVIGAAIVVARRESAHDVAPAAPIEGPAGVAMMLVPSVLPSELRMPFPGQSDVRSQPSGFQERLYGAVDDPGDPTRMIMVEYGSAAAQSMGIPCQRMGSVEPLSGAVPDPTWWATSATPCKGATPFQLAGTTGYTCTVYGLLTAGWWTPEITVLLEAGSAITRDQLVAFAQSLKATPIVTPIPPAPSVDLAADPLPAGWIALVTEDVPYAQRVTESVWVATVGGTDDSPNQLVVHTWTGVDQQGVYAKGAPIQAERITIRGHVGYEYVSARGDRGPQQLDIWWTEQPGMVVHVSSTDLYESAQLIDFIESWHPVDPSEFEAFVTHPANY